MNTKVKALLDSSVIIAGLASKNGGSHEVLVLAELGMIIPYISQDVVREVLKNVQKKLPNCLTGFYTLFKVLPFVIVDPLENDIQYAKSLINSKDALIMAAAISGKVDWLLSLDRHLLDLDWREKLNFAVSSPLDFLQNCILPPK